MLGSVSLITANGNQYAASHQIIARRPQIGNLRHEIPAQAVLTPSHAALQLRNLRHEIPAEAVLTPSQVTAQIRNLHHRLVPFRKTVNLVPRRPQIRNLRREIPAEASLTPSQVTAQIRSLRHRLVPFRKTVNLASHAALQPALSPGCAPKQPDLRPLLSCILKQAML